VQVEANAEAGLPEKLKIKENKLYNVQVSIYPFREEQADQSNQNEYLNKSTISRDANSN